MAQGFPSEFLKIFKNTFFPERLWINASVFKQLLSLHFPVMYSWQLSSSERPLVEKKVHPYISKILQILFTQIFFSFSLTNVCLPCELGKMFAVCWTANRSNGSEIPKLKAFHLIYENLENLNCIRNTFQETQDFLVLTDSVIICIYF